LAFGVHILAFFFNNVEIGFTGAAHEKLLG